MKCEQTFIISDIHLSTHGPVHPKDPLWKKFKQKDFFIDNKFKVFIEEEILPKGSLENPLELILAGDIFDFDSVTQLPKSKRFLSSWLERRRGLHPEERKSRFKLHLIINDHPIFFQALEKFIKAGHKAVFIIGNHDMELHWDSVQKLIVKTMNLNEEEAKRVIFNNWFYISNGDTLIEHGNQHDSHSNCQNPVNPRIQGLRKQRIRIPFGCWANRMMMNGMGYFNPHSDRSYIMTTTQYIKFAFQHLLRREPLLLWTWFWGAIVTLFMTFKDGFAQEVKDPLTIDDQIEDIAKKANATPRIVRTLKEVHCPPTVFDPLGVLRELWLDRALLIFCGIFVAYQILVFFNFIWKISYWWMFLVLGVFFPFFIFYFRSIKSKVIVDVKYYEKVVKLIAKICKVDRVVFGHTHEFVHTNFDSVEYLNSGTWSPAFDDVECTKPSCPKTYVWIRPSHDPEVKGRVANVFEWTEDNEPRLLC